MQASAVERLFSGTSFIPHPEYRERVYRYIFINSFGTRSVKTRKLTITINFFDAFTKLESFSFVDLTLIRSKMILS